VGFEQLLEGFAFALSPSSVLIALLGVLIGTLVGVLPGLGPTAAMALLLPVSAHFGSAGGLVMLTGVWFGAAYGGSTTSILVNIPGEASSVATCLDGYQMARKGRAGAALAVAAIGSWVAGTMAIVFLQFFAPFLGEVALKFGAPEFMALAIFATVVVSGLVGGDQFKSLTMLCLGLFLSTIGIDPLQGFPRFTFGPTRLMQGIDFLPVAIGLFGVAEVLRIGVEPVGKAEVLKVRFRELYPSMEELRRSVAPWLRGGILGFGIGLFPGPAPTIASFVSYSVEKQFSRHKGQFGTGMVEGVAGPEAANNSAVMGAMAPLLGLGIPFSATSAILLAGLRMHNVEPGPMLFYKAPELFWDFIACMYVANVLLLVLNLPLVGIFARAATVRTDIIMPFVLVICMIGSYATRFSMMDVWITLLAGVVGFLLQRAGFHPAPLVLGMVLGPVLEPNFRVTMKLFSGDLFQALVRPGTTMLLAMTVFFEWIAVRALAGQVKDDQD